MTDADQKARTSASADQAWMRVEEFLPDIDRIAETGVPRDVRDVQIVRICLKVLSGKINENQATRLEIE